MREGVANSTQEVPVENLQGERCIRRSGCCNSFVVDQVLPLAQRKHQERGDAVAGGVQGQDSPKAKLLVEEADRGACQRPSGMSPAHDQRVQGYDIGVVDEFLSQRCQVGPVHEGAQSQNHAHGVDMPDLCLADQRQHCHCGDRQAAHDVQGHAGVAAVQTVNQDTAEWQEEERRQGDH